MKNLNNIMIVQNIKLNLHTQQKNYYSKNSLKRKYQRLLVKTMFKFTVGFTPKKVVFKINTNILYFQ